jgi:hypothetical protein
MKILDRSDGIAIKPLSITIFYNAMTSKLALIHMRHANCRLLIISELGHETF